ncbi:MAG TPA: hypothetical protein P5081_09000, partial [Phycisphaerae bacterium]|nr:hypothetical protein [Phycisphaerae bacterium]
MIESRKDKGRLLGICTLVGCLPFMSCVAVAAAQDADPEAGALDYVRAIEEGRVEQLRVGRIMLGYGVDPTSPPVEGAELFYTTDEGRSWSEFILDNPIANPVSFNASDDGLYGFSFVLHSARGSMPRPRAGAVPQRWVMVDRGAPHITMRNLQTPPAGAASRELVVGWLVTDANNNLGQRPVSISYRITSGGDSKARPIARALEAIGEYRWIIPMNIAGDIVIRIEAEDRAGNRD